MNKDISKASIQVEAFLRDKSFPPIVLLDGPWGSGKTYFVKNKFKDDLSGYCKKEELKFKYLSLYGISDKEEFKNLILSIAFTNKEDSTNLIDKVTDSLGSLAKVFGDKGATSGVLNSISGVVKQELYNKANDLLLVLDDLERLDESVAKKILAECLYLVEKESSKINIVIISNENKISLKDDIEKVISNKVTFYHTIEELVEIILEQYKEHAFNHIDFKSILRDSLIIQDITNLRIIKRTVSQFEKIYSQAIEHTDKHFEIVLKSNFEKMLAINYAHYNDGIKLDDLIKDKKLVTYDDKPDGIKLYESDNQLIRYCYNIFNDVEELVNSLGMPSKKHELASFVYDEDRVSLPESEFYHYVSLLEQTLNEGISEKISLLDWLCCASLYTNLKKEGYIKGELDSLSELSSTYTFDYLNKRTKELGVNFDVLVFSNGLGKSYIEDDNFRSIFEAINKEYEEKQVEISTNQLLSNFIESWKKVEEIVLHNQRNHKPFDFSTEVILQGLNSWSNPDVFSFSKFIVREYWKYYGNIKRLPEHGHAFLQELPEQANGLLSEIKQLDKGIEVLLKGNLSRLKERNLKALKDKLNDVISHTQELISEHPQNEEDA
ncbi:hypothetical protein F0237_01125 [Vibrio tubiashii]|uniref:KAP NTPase domain-containing protein n=1 Tax=Vibrio tubiashii TaxID=29498 RepID=A0AAE5EVA5_9VIBR|nr:P-loop NTPase fold protein [Vibrio tubiashii]NOI79245.1 hypothetical protein [Vibrio tubiashii]